jgi:hypothetical protein
MSETDYSSEMLTYAFKSPCIGSTDERFIPVGVSAGIPTRLKSYSFCCLSDVTDNIPLVFSPIIFDSHGGKDF